MTESFVGAQSHLPLWESKRFLQDFLFNGGMHGKHVTVDAETTTHHYLKHRDVAEGRESPSTHYGRGDAVTTEAS